MRMAAAAPPTPALAWSSAPALRLWRAVVLAGFGFLVAHLAFGLGGPHLDDFADKWVYDALELLAAAGCLLRAASTRNERVAWTVLGVGVLFFAIGDVLFDFAYAGSPPSVSICDAFYLAFYPACYAALALLVRSRISVFHRSMWLDGVIAALAASAVSASIVLQVVLDHESGGTAAMAVGLAYPVADLVLLALVILVFALSGWRPGRAWAAAALAFAVITVADSLFLYLNATGSYREGTLVDALWPAAMLLLAFAAWQPASGLWWSNRDEMSTPSATSPQTSGVAARKRPSSSTACPRLAGCQAAKARRSIAAGQSASTSVPSR